MCNLKNAHVSVTPFNRDRYRPVDCRYTYWCAFRLTEQLETIGEALVRERRRVAKLQYPLLICGKLKKFLIKYQLLVTHVQNNSFF